MSDRFVGVAAYAVMVDEEAVIDVLARLRAERLNLV
jgi:hypothetical protein